MSDPLSIAASIAGVASLGFTLAQGFHHLADSIGSAGVEVRIYGDEISAFAKILCRIRIEIQGTSIISNELQDLIEDTIQLCSRIMEPITALLNNLNPLVERFAESDSKLRQIGLRLRWILSIKGKILFHRRALAFQHKMLDTIMALVIIHVTRNPSAQESSLLHSYLSSSATEAQDMLHQCISELDPCNASDVAQSTENTSTEMEHASRKPAITESDTLTLNENGEVSLEADVSLELAVLQENGIENHEATRRLDTTEEAEKSLSVEHIIEDMGIVAHRIFRVVEREFRKLSHIGLKSPENREWLSPLRLRLPRPSRYQVVRVLLLYWDKDDLFVLPELEDLEKCFREDYGFATESFPIPNHNSHLELVLRIAQMVKESEDQDTLIIIYYGGHAKIDESRQSAWYANIDSPWLQWSSIQPILQRSSSDVLLLLDCGSGAAGAGFASGETIFETIAASSWDADAPNPGRFSFTSVIIDILKEWKSKPFSAAMLHMECLARLKHPRPERLNGRDYEARATPVYFMVTSDHRAASIEIRPLKKLADKLNCLPESKDVMDAEGAQEYITIRSGGRRG